VRERESLPGGLGAGRNGVAVASPYFEPSVFFGTTTELVAAELGATDRFTLRNDLEGCWEAPDHVRVGVGRCKADNGVPMRRPSKHKARPYPCFR